MTPQICPTKLIALYAGTLADRFEYDRQNYNLRHELYSNLNTQFQIIPDIQHL